MGTGECRDKTEMVEERKVLKLSDEYLGLLNTILSTLNFLIKVKKKKQKVTQLLFSERFR